jgi:galactosylceramidase
MCVPCRLVLVVLVSHVTLTSGISFRAAELPKQSDTGVIVAAGKLKANQTTHATAAAAANAADKAAVALVNRKVLVGSAANLSALATRPAKPTSSLVGASLKHHNGSSTGEQPLIAAAAAAVKAVATHAEEIVAAKAHRTLADDAKLLAAYAEEPPPPTTSPNSADAAAAAAAASIKAAAKHAEDIAAAATITDATPKGNLRVDISLGHPEDRHPFDGIGALSAGASSRLLQDYPEKQRSDILDLLFKPQFGASLQVLKVEIGGDTQSTDGSEPSHMRSRDEVPNCTRGYEMWLLKEAKARNPKIRLYGLAWGVPGWIGGGNFFHRDNIRYHVSWLQCVRDAYGFDIDYLGVWNEMPWGQVWYIDELARGIQDAKLPARLVLLDAIHGVDKGFTELFSKNATFRGLVEAVGMHYPCEEGPHLKGLSQALSHRKETRFWASEETSTVADWGGAGCWGRMINQNFVRMNATSSIAWSLIWSAYPNLECFGNGLLYAFEPWSGHYDVKPPVWTMAHTTQFTEFGWHYLPVGEAQGAGGAGLLPEGGTFVTMVSPELEDFTIVLETLQGQCFYHSGCYHTKEAKASQMLSFNLGTEIGNGTLLGAAMRYEGILEVWMTNTTHYFQRQPDVHVDSHGIFVVDVPVDAVVTVTTRRGASRGGEQQKVSDLSQVTENTQFLASEDPPSVPFPLPLQEGFDSYGESVTPRFFADQGGAFEVVTAKGPRETEGNKVLEQQVLVPPIAWIGKSPLPYTLLGGVNWTDVSVEVAARLGDPAKSASPPKPAEPVDCGNDKNKQCEQWARGGECSKNTEWMVQNCHRSCGKCSQAILAGVYAAPPPERHVGLCVRLARYYYFGSNPAPDAYCLRLVEQPSPSWTLSSSGETLATGPLDAEVASKASAGDWLKLRLEARGAHVQAWIDGKEVASLTDAALPFGQVALECGYHRCQFDDLDVQQLEASSSEPIGLLAGRRTAGMALAKAGKRRTLVRRMQGLSFDYHGRTCEPPPRLPRKRRDFSGFVGFAFKPKHDELIESLGRMAVAGGHPWTRIHNISLFETGKKEPLASVALPIGSGDQVGIDETVDGWVFASLRQPILLNKGSEYLLVSSETANGDAFYDASRLEVDDDIEPPNPVYLNEQGWTRYHEPMQGYGPLNALLALPKPVVPATVSALPDGVVLEKKAGDDLKPENIRLRGQVADLEDEVERLRASAARSLEDAAPLIPKEKTEGRIAPKIFAKMADAPGSESSAAGPPEPSSRQSGAAPRAGAASHAAAAVATLLGAFVAAART